MLVCTFKIGDTVHARTYGNYVVTDRGKPCKVVDIEGATIKLRCLWEVHTFWESYVAFEKMYSTDILNSGDTVRFVKDYYIECVTIPKGVKVEFLEYYTYGAKIFYKDEIIRVPMKYIRKAYSGLLI